MVPDDRITGNRGARHRLRGPSRIEPVAPTFTPPQPKKPTGQVLSVTTPKTQSTHKSTHKKRVLFVCIGNSCRSQMAEAFARAYGADIMDVQSAGLSPAAMIASQTKQTLAERNLSINDHFPKGLDIIRRQTFDLVINMSGIPVTLPAARVIEWKVPDPIGQKEFVYRAVADQIEGLVMRLILDLRNSS